jgi:hypothetical protein
MKLLGFAVKFDYFVTSAINLLLPAQLWFQIGMCERKSEKLYKRDTKENFLFSLVKKIILVISHLFLNIILLFLLRAILFACMNVHIYSLLISPLYTYWLSLSLPSNFHWRLFIFLFDFKWDSIFMPSYVFLFLFSRDGEREIFIVIFFIRQYLGM